MVLTIASVAILLSALWAARLLSPAGAKHSPIEQKIQASLKPVVGAFGWKLGEKLPTQFASKVRYSMYSFKPETEMPPFELFDLELLNDGRIYGVRAEGFVHGYLDFSGAKERLISLLTEKYGLRQHNPKNLLGDDEYIFGSEDHAACLQVREEKSFTLEYFDKSLRDIAYAEIEARQAQEEAEKKAVLKKGL